MQIMFIVLKIVKAIVMIPFSLISLGLMRSMEGMGNYGISFRPYLNEEGKERVAQEFHGNKVIRFIFKILLLIDGVLNVVFLLFLFPAVLGILELLIELFEKEEDYEAITTHHEDGGCSIDFSKLPPYLERTPLWMLWLDYLAEGNWIEMLSLEYWRTPKPKLFPGEERPPWWGKSSGRRWARNIP